MESVGETDVREGKDAAVDAAHLDEASEGSVAPKPGSGSFRTWPVLLMSAAHLVHDVYTGFLAPLLPLFIRKLSLSLAEAGFLTTVMQFPSLLNPMIGSLADRAGGRWFVILAPTLSAVPMCLAGLAPTYSVLLVLLFAAGLSTSLFHVPAPVLVARLSGARRGRGMSLYMTGGELARALSPLVAVSAVAAFGLEGMYSIAAVALLASGWMYLMLRNVQVSPPRRQHGGMWETWREMRPLLLPLAGILCARGLMHASLTAFLPTFIEQETGSLWMGGAALTVFFSAGVTGVLAAGTLSDRYGRRRSLLCALAVAPVALFAFAGSTGPWRVGALAVTGFTLLSTTPVMLAMVQDRATRSPAAANGLFMMVSFIARSAIVVLAGLCGDHFGLQTTYYVSAALGLMALPLVFLLPASDRRGGDR